MKAKHIELPPVLTGDVTRPGGTPPGRPKVRSATTTRSESGSKPHYLLPTEAWTAHRSPESHAREGRGKSPLADSPAGGRGPEAYSHGLGARSRSSAPRLPGHGGARGHPTNDIAVMDVDLEPTSYASGRGTSVRRERGLVDPFDVDIEPVRRSQPERTGRMAYEGSYFSHIFHGERHVHIWVPPSYHEPTSADKRYPVLYCTDGQNMFSTSGDGAAFGWGNWQVDTWCNRLIAAGLMREVILVGIDCHPRSRYHEYRGPAFPYSRRHIELLRDNPNYVSNFFRHPGDDSRYDAFRRFLIEELKPQVDKHYRTLKDPRHTGVLGSSMGGVVSAALCWQRPDVFGLAGIISGAFGREERWLIQRFFMRHPPFEALNSGEESKTGASTDLPSLTVSQEPARSEDFDLRPSRSTVNSLSSVAAFASFRPHSPAAPRPTDPVPHLPIEPSFPEFSTGVPFKAYVDSGILSDHIGGFGIDDKKSTDLAVRELRRLGWRDGESLWYHVDDEVWTSDEQFWKAGVPQDKWDQARGNQHNERYWSHRIWRCLMWLFPADE
ncbi:Alpha/Beta hydrolase protein [Hyaloraphidium curvatum]|nr:Alpha/Beta hydrolase protein [Hyaloraphidium curvatum]